MRTTAKTAAASITPHITMMKTIFLRLLSIAVNLILLSFAYFIPAESELTLRSKPPAREYSPVSSLNENPHAWGATSVTLFGILRCWSLGQLMKAFSPIFFTPSGIMTFVRDEQFAQSSSLTSETVVGTEKVSSDTQFMKAPASMAAMPSSISAFLSEKQFEKASAPMVETAVGMKTFSIFWQAENAPGEIVTTESGMYRSPSSSTEPRYISDFDLLKRISSSKTNAGHFDVSNDCIE